MNFHGSTIPRGWSREFPHLMSMEAVFGAEQYKFRRAFTTRAAWHNTVLPFTRNVIGPMDYTPVTFTDVRFPAHDHQRARTRAVGGLRIGHPALRRQRRGLPRAA